MEVLCDEILVASSRNEDTQDNFRHTFRGIATGKLQGSNIADLGAHLAVTRRLLSSADGFLHDDASTLPQTGSAGANDSHRGASSLPS